MKVNIEKFQNGGGFATFTPIIHSPASSFGSTNSQTNSSTTSKEPASILDDDTFKELLTKGGLTNDVNALVSELIDLEKSQGNTPYTSSANRTLALRMIGKVNELRNSKLAWDKANSVAESSGGIGEVAVNSSGLMYVKNDGGQVQTISTKDFAKGKGKYQALTVSELLSERRYNPNLTGREDVFDVAQNSTGVEKINNDIRAIIASLGEESSEDTKFVSKAQLAQKMAGATGVKPSYAEMAGIQELNKITSGVKTERAHADVALNYIWRTLDPHKQQKLAAIAALNGESNPSKFIYDMIMTQTNISQSSSVTPVTSTGASSDGSGGSGMRSLTQFQLLHKDKLMSPQSHFTFNDPKLGVLFNGSIAGVSPVITPDGQSVGMTTLQNVLNAGYNQFLEPSKVYFGDKLVDPTEFNNLIYNGQDGAKVYMPVDSSGAPDYKEFAKFKEIYAVYESNKDHWSAQQSMDFFKRNNYNLQIDEKYEDGDKVKIIRDNSKVKPFWVMGGYTNDGTTLTDNNSFITKLSRDEETRIMPQLKKVWVETVGKKTINHTPDKSWHVEDYYKGMITIPYRQGYAAIVDAMVGQGPREQIPTMGTVQTNNLYSNQKVVNSTSGAFLNK